MENLTRRKKRIQKKILHGFEYSHQQHGMAGSHPNEIIPNHNDVDNDGEFGLTFTVFPAQWGILH